MKKLLLAGLMLMLPALGKAQVFTGATSIKPLAQYQTTCSTFTVGTSTIEVTGNTVGSTSNPAGISAVKVENWSATASVYCNHSTNVTVAGGAVPGDFIAPSPAGTQPNSLSWVINMFQGWWCVASGANTTIMVCLVK